MSLKLILFIGVLSCSSWTTLKAQKLADRPNVLFIAVDDLNDWIGALNIHPQVKTPNIDQLAERGTLFTNAHTQAPICNPSRVSVLTGLRPTTTGIYGLAPYYRDIEAMQNVETLPQYFAKHGYRTLTSGKVLHHITSTDTRREIEFDEWGPDGGIGLTPEQKLVKKPVHMQGSHPWIDWGIFPEEGDSVRGDFQVANWTVQQLERFGSEKNTKDPFFMAIGFFLPHVPLYTTQKWFDLYPDEDQIVLPPAPEDDRADIPDFAWYLHWFLTEPRLSWLEEHDQWRLMVRAYLAAISFMDAQVGRVLDALKAQGLNNNTIVVFWSDHGWHLGEKGITGKNSLWERSTHVPLIFAGPSVSKRARSSKPVELLDIYPTLIELADLPEKEGLEGISLVPQLKDANAHRERPAITTHNPGNHAVRSEQWRYIRYADGSEELYDHSRDPYEWKNLANNPDYAVVIENHARWIPTDGARHAPGSKGRVLKKKDEVWFWEGEPIVFDELIR